MDSDWSSHPQKFQSCLTINLTNSMTPINDSVNMYFICLLKMLIRGSDSLKDKHYLTKN